LPALAAKPSAAKRWDQVLNYDILICTMNPSDPSFEYRNIEFQEPIPVLFKRA